MTVTAKIRRLVNEKTGERAIKIVLNPKHSSLSERLVQEIYRHAIGTATIVASPSVVAFTTDNPSKDVASIKQLLIDLSVKVQ